MVQTISREMSTQQTAWRLAAERWLARWRRGKPVLGAVVAGSHVTGKPGPNSDLDIQVLLGPDCPWRERGNAVVDGFLIEYFAGTAVQVRHDFIADHARGRPSAQVMLTTGVELLADPGGQLAALRAEAEAWLRRPPPRASGAERRCLPYAVWDARDNIRDAAARQAPDLLYVFHNELHRVYEVYCRFLGQRGATAMQQYRALGERAVRDRYRLPEFPDAEYVRLHRAAIRAAPARVPAAAEAVFGHVLAAMGGFAING